MAYDRNWENDMEIMLKVSIVLSRKDVTDIRGICRKYTLL